MFVAGGGAWSSQQPVQIGALLADRQPSLFVHDRGWLPTDFFSWCSTINGAWCVLALLHPAGEDHRLWCCL